MERIKALQAQLPREQSGRLNLLYMNALAELHNYAARFGCDYRAMTPRERTAFVRSVGRQAIRNRRLVPVDGGLGAAAEVIDAAAVPHMAALELIDWLMELQETVLQEKIPILLTQDRDSEVFSELLREIGGFFPDFDLRDRQ